MAQNKTQNRTKQKHPNGPHRVIEATSFIRKPGIPQPGSPRSKSRRTGMTFTQAGEQGLPRAIGKYDAASVRAFQSCSLHGVGTPAPQIPLTARTAAMRLLPALI